MVKFLKSARRARLAALPAELQDDALLDWRMAADLAGYEDVQYARKTLIAQGLPLVELSPRRKRPTLRALREHLAARQRIRKK